MIERIKVMLFLFSRLHKDCFLIATKKSNSYLSFIKEPQRFVLKSSKEWKEEDFFVEYFQGRIIYYKGSVTKE